MVENLLGLLEEKQFQGEVDTVMKGIRENALVIAQRYNHLMDVARDDFAVAEKTLVAKIVTKVYEESKKIKEKFLESERMNQNELKNRFYIPIQKWKELKIYGDFLKLNPYGISLEKRLNETLNKYHLDDVIEAYFDHPYYSKGTMMIMFTVAEIQNIDESK